MGSVLFGQVSAASAFTTLISNLAETSDTTATIYNQGYFAGSFTTAATSFDVSSVTLLFEQRNTPDAPFVLTLNSDNSGVPTNTALATFTNPSSYSTSLTNTIFTLSTPFTLAANTTYWLSAMTTSANEIYLWGATNSTNYTGVAGASIPNGFAYSNNQGASWTPYSAFALQFSVDGTVATSVPFEFNSATGFAVLGICFGAFKLRKDFLAKK